MEVSHCYKPSGLSTNCLHWIRKKYDQDAELCYDFVIRQMIEKANLQTSFRDVYEHVKNSHATTLPEVPNDCLAINPYKYLTKEETTAILLSKPPTNLLPIESPDEKKINIEIIKAKTFDETKMLLIEFISGDCWGLYIRDKSHIPVKVFFDSRKYYKTLIEYEYPKITKYKNELVNTKTNVENENRQKVIEGLDFIMKEFVDKNLTLCIVMGFYNSKDIYCTSNKDNTFDFVIIHY
ncbi:MAG: hypothetical protein Edafosvirus3_17 [Edafosvirus sp.]|uniref:Uncharacterized protein n=1 Tax=Edafosvirus sp. TaxID=2487765 RepID=A0A3G4ZWY5_9VIRU|nr:MAG: hypothetical protein Edafosvirus3_17 [Edafosvirus sp.]